MFRICLIHFWLTITKIEVKKLYWCLVLLPWWSAWQKQFKTTSAWLGRKFEGLKLPFCSYMAGSRSWRHGICSQEAESNTHRASAFSVLFCVAIRESFSHLSWSNLDNPSQTGPETGFQILSSWQSRLTITACGCLNQNSLPRLMYLNAWSPGSGIGLVGSGSVDLSE